MSQNIGRLPVVSDTTRSWSIASNPYGDEPEVAGFAVSCFCPVTREHTIESDIFATAEEARAELELILTTQF